MAARLGQDAPMSTKRDDVFARIDAANAADPHLEAGEPVELLYGQRMTAEQAAAILQAVENLERQQRREQHEQRARSKARVEKDW